ncbi:hypothetical protein JL721_1839 [Aureococcus anophagefferens]|nr:hypothetical protein JL721_1839 [Aureococcus anophagefferens]
MLSKSFRMLSSFFRRRRSKPSLDSWAVDEDWERGGSRGVSAARGRRRPRASAATGRATGPRARAGRAAAAAGKGHRTAASAGDDPSTPAPRSGGGSGASGGKPGAVRGPRESAAVNEYWGNAHAPVSDQRPRGRPDARRGAAAAVRAAARRAPLAKRSRVRRARRRPRERRPARGAAKPAAPASVAAARRRASDGGGAAVASPRRRRRDAERDLRSEPADDAAAATGAKGGKLCCSKCDGAHESSKCPHFKKQRDSHPDATRNLGKGKTLGSDCPPVVVRRARVIPQPPDGSCLFHSLSYGLRDGRGATSLRREIMAFIRNNPDLKISDTPLRDWIHWDALVSVATYTQRMSRGGWGGGIEMAATSELNRNKQGAEKTVRVCYRGGVHYDSLVI